MTSLDPQFPLTDMPAPWLPHIADVLANVDVFICDERESRNLFDTDDHEAALRTILRSGPKVAAIKLGSRGALVGDGRETLAQPAIEIPVEQVVESVGAGDAFDAGFLVSLLNGDSLADAAKHATAVASITLAGRGGAERISRGLVEDQLAKVPAPTRRG